ncbi:hypothetical protein M405DRAFT_882855 [Rhizopogon salebrosus TDB-379]|nr:hypothetical protein M405DRAFT_882855 [Rhizopogon salebrosus TDB-379]
MYKSVADPSGPRLSIVPRRSQPYELAGLGAWATRLFRASPPGQLGGPQSIALNTNMYRSMREYFVRKRREDSEIVRLSAMAFTLCGKAGLRKLLPKGGLVLIVICSLSLQVEVVIGNIVMPVVTSLYSSIWRGSQMAGNRWVAEGLGNEDGPRGRSAKGLRVAACSSGKWVGREKYYNTNDDAFVNAVRNNSGNELIHGLARLSDATSSMQLRVIVRTTAVDCVHMGVSNTGCTEGIISTSVLADLSCPVTLTTMATLSVAQII